MHNKLTLGYAISCLFIGTVGIIHTMEQPPQLQSNKMVKPTDVDAARKAHKAAERVGKKPPRTKLERKKIFVEQIEKFKQLHGDLNADIPQKTASMFRLVTYNVHNFTDPMNKPNLSSLLDVLRTINADVVILQQAIGHEILNKRGVRKKFANLGYMYGSFAGGSGADSKFGNAILSKVPFTSVPYKRNFNFNGKSHARSFVKVELDLSKYNKKNLAIYGSHFEKSRPHEGWEEASELIYLADKYDKNKNVLIGADFNATRKEKALQELEKNGFVNCFVAIKHPEPELTHWAGKTIDHFYLRNKDLHIGGCYLYYSNVSDHLPVIMDIDLSK